MLAKCIKLLHELGAIGVMGAYAACVVILLLVPGQPEAAELALLDACAAVCRWLLLPSLGLAVVSGLLAIACTEHYLHAGWVYVKAALGLLMFQGTLLTVAGPTRQILGLFPPSPGVDSHSSDLAGMLASEWRAVWVMLALSLANVVLAIWRPRLGTRPVGHSSTAQKDESKDSRLT